MEQLEFFEIPSPCINVCESNERGYCKGCYRSREERQGWISMSDPQKREVLRLCSLRKKRAEQQLMLDQVRRVEGT
ncbi:MULTISPECIES: DUF1289 domain-containing protein [Oligella]|uniref:Fe-S protein n=2 Tax=Oligella urethralis TaxID=90245 RepID=A0A096AB52_9BURK|nr:MULTISPECIES: DUF1289 domain-containing protein [Oligella]KGF27957.1 hypothetical protein HMPREF2130_09755 [Oligella urethralis DNF00040]OFS83160.1 hypothetical protein HMPREF3144_09370 [Oligella sp. HMSC05A10]PMC15719.1 DUF1289 domain-containing protein [Oligella urethralis]WOS38645.1 hypothetical protein RP300_02222 [Oligella urethralis]SPY08953.1 Predicted Fe-S protein [Oligella urethralis]